MNKLIKCVLVLLSFSLSITAQKEKKSQSLNTVEHYFRQIPDTQRLAVYWYWMSDNISKEGVVKASGREWESFSLEELDALWNEAKGEK
jgi:hypothetical protein